MKRASTPFAAAEIDEQEASTDPQQNYFWTVGAADIESWLKQRRPELTLFAGMSMASLLVSGAATAILFSPNLGQKLIQKPLIDDATLAASRRVSLGDQLLGQVARVLEIEIIETQGPEIGRHTKAAPAMTIVAKADKAAPMLEADTALGLKAIALATGVGLGVTGLMKLIPLNALSALGPRRRRPLSQRLSPGDISAQPLSPVISTTPAGVNPVLIPGALASLSTAKASSNGESKNLSPQASRGNPQSIEAQSKARPSRRKALRRQLTQMPKGFNRARQDSPSGQPGASPSSPLRPSANPTSLSPASSQMTPRSHPYRQPASFIPLQSFSNTALIPGQGKTAPNQALWSNPALSPQPGTQPRQGKAQFAFMEELDMRRQYPLDPNQ